MATEKKLNDFLV